LDSITKGFNSNTEGFESIGYGISLYASLVAHDSVH